MKVCSNQCDQCLFSKNRIVSKKRASEIIKTALSQDTHFICHKGSIANEEIVCRGWFDRYPTQMIRIAQRLNVVKFIDPENLINK